MASHGGVEKVRAAQLRDLTTFSLVKWIIRRASQVLQDATCSRTRIINCDESVARHHP
jgi:hypothetical protein